MGVETLNIPLPEDLLKLKWNGQFDLLKEMIDIRLQKDIPEQLKERLIFEKEIIDMIPEEFPYTKEEAISLLKDKINDFKEEEFEQLFKESAFEFIFIDSKIRFKNDFYDNLVKTRPQYALRNKEEISYKHYELLDEVITKMKDKGELSYKIHVKVCLKIKEEYEEIGNIVRVHLPIPIEYAQVEDLKIIKTIPSATLINDNNQPHRTVYFEVPLQKNQEFSVEYEFINHSYYHHLDESIVTLEHPNCCLEEKAPHILFTPYLKSLVSDIIKDETNPLLKAKKIYEYITSHIMYSFVRPYITLPPIAEYMATGLKGDCGLQALLFITMCRIAKIPACWQAGLYATPKEIGNHDWARFYIAPYGWLYADCSFGGSGYRNGSTLRRDFYFGHLEPFRIPSTSDFQCAMNPPMNFIRRDPYDNQTGEIQYIDHRLMSNQYVMYQEIIEIKEK
ncbi:MAG: transglutaminase-like domain-containing protein [Coprobacillus sp.]